MSDALHDREKGFEARQKLNDELKFKAEARRNKKTGLWLAEKMGISGVEADAYAKSVVLADLEEAGDADVVGKVMADIAEKGLSLSEADVRAQMAIFFAQAVQELNGEYPEPLGNDHERVGD